MRDKKRLKTVLTIMFTFILLAVVVFYFAVTEAISLQLGLLMLIGLVGLYIGFGILFLVYRLIAKLD